MDQEVIRQGIVQNHHAVLIVVGLVTMCKPAQKLGGVAYVVAISMTSGLVQSGNRNMIMHYDELGGGRFRVLFSDGTKEVYFLEAIDAEGFFTKFSNIATRCSLKKLQVAADLIEDNNGCDFSDVLTDLPSVERSDDLDNYLDVLIKMMCL